MAKKLKTIINKSTKQYEEKIKTKENEHNKNTLCGDPKSF